MEVATLDLFWQGHALYVLCLWPVLARACSLYMCLWPVRARACPFKFYSLYIYMSLWPVQARACLLCVFVTCSGKGMPFIHLCDLFRQGHALWGFIHLCDLFRQGHALYVSLWPVQARACPLCVIVTCSGKGMPFMCHCDLFWQGHSIYASLWPVLARACP